MLGLYLNTYLNLSQNKCRKKIAKRLWHQTGCLCEICLRRVEGTLPGTLAQELSVLCLIRQSMHTITLRHVQK